MDALGTNQQLVCQASNAEGRLSWSPDNSRIVFTRSGLVDLKGPDLVGGRHKVYDLFICYLDSARAGNKTYFTRLTHDLGSRGPEWTTDQQKIIFWKNMNANRVNSREPNYQLCSINPDGTDLTVLRQYWQDDRNRFLVTPSMNSQGHIAFVFFDEMQPGGLVVLPRSELSMSLDSIKSIADRNQGYISPTWSPDDSWLAIFCQSGPDSGLCIASPDLQEKYPVTAPPSRLQFGGQPASFSPNSKWLTFSTSDKSIWICDITGGGLRRLTSPGRDQAPCWSK